ncbi:MAG TPA: hypothetical protein VEI97_14205, partial [bacterium]|nr:hypothetical protein [bacterium]
MAGEWFLNRPNGSIEGGIPGFLFWDGVVPWTTPVDPVGDPNWPNSNGWWPIVNGDFRPGIFQPFADQLGWQRNIVGDYGAYASFKRNFPAGDPSDTGFKIALVVCEGLQQSGVAPPRSLRDRPDQLTPEDDPTTGYWLYNWTDGEGKGALHRCWELYMRDFMELGDDYYVIVGLPEREIKQMFYA